MAGIHAATSVEVASVLQELQLAESFRFHGHPCHQKRDGTNVQESLKHACSVTSRLLSLYTSSGIAVSKADETSDRSVQEALQGIMFAS